MASTLDEILREHRRRLIQRERAAFRRMLEEYRRLKASLDRQLEEIAAVIIAARSRGEVVTELWLARQTRILDLLEQVNREIVRYGGRVTGIVTGEQAAAINIAADQTRDVIRVIAGKRPEMVGATFSPRVVETAVGMMGDGSPMWSYFAENFAPAVVRKIRDEIVEAAALGTDFRTLARRLKSAGDITRYRSLAMARTEVNRVRRSATLEQYRESGVVTGWEWAASKSSRTCPACLALDGRIFKLDDEFPQHINCRCTLLPVIDGVETPPRTLGRDWFDRQPYEVKEQILGKLAAESYARGEFKLEDAVGWATSKEFGKRVYTKKLADILKGS